MPSRPGELDRGEHRRRRKRLPPPEGDPCPFCWLPMWPDMALDADHVNPRATGGTDGPLRWAHATCNRREGGRLRQALRQSQPVRSRRW